MPNRKISQGCVSDCKTYKLEIRMRTMCNVKEFSIGSHVKVIGVLKYGQTYPYLSVMTKDNIKKESKIKKSVGEVLKGGNTPSKRINEIKSEDGILSLFKI